MKISDGVVRRDAWTPATSVLTWADGTRESAKDGYICVECHKQDCKFPVERGDKYRVQLSSVAKVWEAENPII